MPRKRPREARHYVVYGEPWPVVTYVRFSGALLWRECIQALREIARDITGKPIDWGNTGLDRSMCETAAEEAAQWEEWCAAKRHVLYDVDATGQWRRVHDK